MDFTCVCYISGLFITFPEHFILDALVVAQLLLRHRGHELVHRVDEVLPADGQRVSGSVDVPALGCPDGPGWPFNKTFWASVLACITE